MSSRPRPEGTTWALALWAAAGLAAGLVLAWSFPRAFPFAAAGWSVNRGEAVAIALDGFRHLGEAVADPYVVAILDHDGALERRLRLVSGGGGREAALLASRLGERMRRWEVSVYSPDAEPEDWTYYGAVSAGGRLIEMERRQPPGREAATGEAIEPAAARRQAEELLRRLGYDPAAFSTPEPRRVETPERTDLVLRYRDREAALDGLGRDLEPQGLEPQDRDSGAPEEALPYGFDVAFAGDRLHCFHPWFEDPERERLRGEASTLWLAIQARFWVPFALFPLVAVSFLRRYHAGTLDVRRGVRLFLLLAVCGALFMVLVARGTASNDYDVPRRQGTWIWGLHLFLLWVAPAALTAALAWTVGEARCRERWSGKLAAFDAVLGGRLGSATVARAALRGPAAGLAIAAAIAALARWLAHFGVEPMSASLFGPFHEASWWPGASLLLFYLLYGVLTVCFALLVLLPPAVARLGRWAGGAAVAAFQALVFYSPFSTLPAGSDLVFAALAAAAIVALFLAYDLLTALLAFITTGVVLASAPYLFAGDAFLRLQAVPPLLVLALPLAFSLRGLARGTEAVYHWQEEPAHVRRIANRERQRLELETARRIQTSILPELPSRLDGVELAHAYLPATEVGGDFYEVAELPDGRLALAVGDVAGHGVASGLVMAMARSALAAQLPIDPSVEAVFQTLNRVLRDTAEKSLMTTLCYGLLDRRGRRLTFASAGHLFPYVVSEGGMVRWLESVAYPLGVRDRLDLRPTEARLAAGDTLVLVSDGVIEARPEDSGDLFGFDRLEQSLRRHAGAAPPTLCHEILADLARFTGPGPREDDQTILVARLA